VPVVVEKGRAIAVDLDDVLLVRLAGDVHERHAHFRRDVDELEAREKKKDHHEIGSRPSRTIRRRSPSKILEGLHTSSGPLNLQALDARRLPETEMESQVLVRFDLGEKFGSREGWARSRRSDFLRHRRLPFLDCLDRLAESRRQSWTRSGYCCWDCWGVVVWELCQLRACWRQYGRGGFDHNHPDSRHVHDYCFVFDIFVGGQGHHHSHVSSDINHIPGIDQHNVQADDDHDQGNYDNNEGDNDVFKADDNNH